MMLEKWNQPKCRWMEKTKIIIIYLISIVDIYLPYRFPIISFESIIFFSQSTPVSLLYVRCIALSYGIFLMLKKNDNHVEFSCVMPSTYSSIAFPLNFLWLAIRFCIWDKNVLKHFSSRKISPIEYDQLMKVRKSTNSALFSYFE